MHLYIILLQEQKLQAMILAAEAERIQGPNYPETEVFHTMVAAFRSSLSEFMSQAEQCCDELEAMVNLCLFCTRVSFHSNCKSNDQIKGLALCCICAKMCF